MLKDEQQRRQLIESIVELPIENVWLRISGAGATATGAMTRHLIEAIRDLHQFAKPLVADCAGGFSGLATLALGAVGGISHGVGLKETFRAADWKSPRGRGGSSRRIYVPDLDRHFTEEQLNKIFEARGGRSRFACNDISCCPHGKEDMFDNADAHFITQRARQLSDLAKVNEERTPDYFLLHHLDPAVRSARYAARLKIIDEKVKGAVKDAGTRLVRLRDAIGDLHSQDENKAISTPGLSRGRNSDRRGAGAIKMASAVAKLLGDLRDRGALKGTDVANIAAVSQATVSRWVSGKASPQPKPNSSFRTCGTW